MPQHYNFLIYYRFLGHPGDMMLLRNILTLEFPKSTQFLLATSNAGESKSIESLDIMGKRLALEIMSYCSGNVFCCGFVYLVIIFVEFVCLDKIPDLLVPRHTPTINIETQHGKQSKYSRSRISFIGHSAGGLIIRRCLQVSL